jgi:hypothetical protein
LKLHRVRLFPFEINRDLTEQKINRIDPAEPPAFVHHVGAGRQAIEGGSCSGGELAGFNGLFNVGIHSGCRG